MPTDLDIIAQLEKRIGRKLEKLDEINWASVGYQLNEQQQVIDLGLHACELRDLPAEIGQLENLQELNLYSNQLRDLPTEIGQLENLQGLWLNSNQLRDLPAEIGQLENLQTLNLSSNQLSELPAEIGKIPSLELFVVENNPLKTPPYEIATEGLPEIRDYFDALGNNPHTLSELKIILVGDGAAGKTSLVKQLFEEKFDPHESQTHGILIRDLAFSTHTLPNVNAHLWDFGGQETMHATHQFFLSKRSLYVLVLDGRKDEKAEYWLQHIELLGDKSPTLVVLNKMDQHPGFDVNRRFLKDKYPFIVDFHKISCLEKTGIEKLKQAIQETTTKVEILQTKWPENWLAVKQALEQKNKENIDYMPYDSYIDLCKENGVTRESFQHTLIKFLHDLGVVIHFREALLEETNVINPEWVTQAVYAIITSKLLANQQGTISKADAGQLLNLQTHPSHKHNYIIELMKKFELCYELDDKTTLLMPDLLPVEEPEFTLDVDKAIRFILEYKFLPKTIIARFIVKMHRDIKQELRWRTGVVIEDTQFAATAVIKVDEDARQIFIDVNGTQKREYFAAILHTFRAIHKMFAKIDVTENMRLPDIVEFLYFCTMQMVK